MHLIPQSWSHLLILVSVFPSFGLVCVLGFYIAGLLTDNNVTKRTGLVLFAVLALLSVPIYNVVVRKESGDVEAEHTHKPKGWEHTNEYVQVRPRLWNEMHISLPPRVTPRVCFCRL